MPRTNPALFTPSEVATRLGLAGPRRVRILCGESRFPGAFQVGQGNAARWLIPESAIAAFLADDTKRRGPKPKATR